MLRTRRLALMGTIALLALPASSFAQSAGDNQYQDPLAGGGGGGHTSSGHHGSPAPSGSSSSGGGSGQSSSAGTPSTSSNVPTSGSGGTGTSTSQATAAGSSGKQLPRTGFDVIVTFELGFAMLLVGLVAQRMIVLRERRGS